MPQGQSFSSERRYEHCIYIYISKYIVLTKLLTSTVNESTYLLTRMGKHVLRECFSKLTFFLKARWFTPFRAYFALLTFKKDLLMKFSMSYFFYPRRFFKKMTMSVYTDMLTLNSLNARERNII